MAQQQKKYRIFFSAAEPSGDALCAGLIAALKKGGSDIDFTGVGGPKMASAGCNLLETTTGRAAMTYNAFTQVGHFYLLIRKIRNYLRTGKVDLVVVCDSPAFNFHVAKAAKRIGIKTLFYVAPQLWAWGGWRIRKLRKYCDRLCCILPFEEKWFAERAVPAVFVGNPLLDDLPSDLACYRKWYADYDPQNAVFALMPGSRAAEIDSLWVPMQQIALRLKEKYRSAKFVAVAVDEARRQILEARQVENFTCRYDIGSVSETAGRADFAIVASGSATLQVAAAGCPMVVMYQSSKVLWYMFGRWLVRTKHFSLVNILAGKELVPEFMPYFRSIEPVVERIDRFLEDREGLARLSSELVALAGSLKVRNASQTTAKIVADMLHS